MVIEEYRWTDPRGENRTFRFYNEDGQWRVSQAYPGATSHRNSDFDISDLCQELVKFCVEWTNVTNLNPFEPVVDIAIWMRGWEQPLPDDLMAEVLLLVDARINK